MNIGDAVSGACLYFDFPLPVRHIDIKNITLSKEELAESFIIVGGGGHMHIPRLDYNDGTIGPLEEISKMSNSKESLKSNQRRNCCDRIEEIAYESSH